MQLYRHVIKFDTGLAPNPFHGYCTSALCTPSHAKHKLKLRQGDWLVGNSGKDDGYRLVYAMRIYEDPLSMNQYFHDDRFEHKKPKPFGTPEEQCGDNIYFVNDAGCWKRLPSPFHNSCKEFRNDIGCPVFVSEHFYYFGDRRVAIPDKLKWVIWDGRGIKKHTDGHSPDEFVSWLEANYKPGILGKPRDKPPRDTGSMITECPEGEPRVQSSSGTRYRGTSCR